MDYLNTRAILSAQDDEVRLLASYTGVEEAFLSAGANQVHIWTSSEDGSGFREKSSIHCSCNCIHSLCTVPPDEENPEGIILVGTDEPSIWAYRPSDKEPIYTLTGHTDKVCSLSVGKFGTTVSGSWDKTAKVWLKQRCVMTLTGHDGAVFCIRLIAGYMLTGSSDNTIKRWRAGKCELTFNGHSDWVRDISIISQSEFLSCSNDGTICQWQITGDCVKKYTGHSSPVLSIAHLGDGQGFVSVAEDGKLCFWKDGQCLQNAAHDEPHKFTCICAVANSCVVVGVSDNTIQVFTVNSKPDAPKNMQEKLAAKEENSAALAAKEEEKSTAKEEQKPVAKAEAESAAKEVDKAAAKDEDKANSKDEDKAAAKKEEKPASKDEERDTNKKSDDLMVKPKTGNLGSKKGPRDYFPETSYITFVNFNKKGPFQKLREFNIQVSKEDRLWKAEMEHLDSLVSDQNKKPTPDAMKTLWKLLNWPNAELLFPALDILRYVIHLKHVNEELCAAKEGQRFIDYVHSILSSASSPAKNNLLVLRALCNAFSHPSGEQLLLSSYERLVPCILLLPNSTEQSLQVAQSSFFLNLVVAIRSAAASVEGRTECLTNATQLCQSVTDSEAIFRLLVAIGTAVVDDRSCQKFARSLDLQNFLNMCCCEDAEKIRHTAEEVTKLVG